MEKTARIFRSFDEAEKADREYYHSLTPEERLALVFEIVAAQNPHGTEQRLERVCRVIKLKED
jgi:uncharacterized protein YdeI (YjbR/CyaY-like superfamily)